MKKMLLIAGVLLATLVYYGCNKFEFSSEGGGVKADAAAAKSWLGYYLQHKQLQPQFANLNYHWDMVGVHSFDNGYQALTVPVTEPNMNPNTQACAYCIYSPTSAARAILPHCTSYCPMQRT
jgi:hypothetical protein